MALAPGLQARFDELTRSHKVVLFMKGDRAAPRCGFSARVVGMLDELIDDYLTVDVLADPDVRDGIKAYSDWPTIPQLYVDGEFVGGCDIATELYGSGELHKLLGIDLGAATVPHITVTPSAAAAFAGAMDGDSGALRFTVTADFRHGLEFGPKGAIDVVVQSGGIELVLDRGSASRADGVVIDYVQGPEGAGFKIDNPNAPPEVRQIGPAELKRMLDQGVELTIVDVRTAQERAIAAIDGSILLDNQTAPTIEALPKETLLVFQCRSGHRSQAAAEHFLAQGFTNVFNLAGGINAWAAQVDPSLPQY